MLQETPSDRPTIMQILDMKITKKYKQKKEFKQVRKTFLQLAAALAKFKLFGLFRQKF